jgi:exonuclease SbcD
MKVLHTSDWHVGKAIRGESRADEHRAVLQEIVGIAKSEQVDLAIVAGDLFDSASPNAEAEEIVYRALLGLASAGIPVAVIAGNHDNAKRLQAVAPLLELGKVHVVSEPTRPDEGGVMELTTAAGTNVRLAMLPFVSKRGIVRAEQLMEQAAFEHAQVYAERLRLLVDHMCRGFTDDTVNILAAHAFVLGAAAGGGERPAHLVEEYAITAQSFPASIGYGALGHLHRPQKLPAGPPLHYCGSPLQLDFGEGEQTKQVNIVTIEPGAPADVKAVELNSGWRLRTLRGGLDELLTTEPPPNTWLRIIVQGATRAGLAQMVRDALGPGVVDVRVEEAGRAAADGGVDHSNRSPLELFDSYLEREGVADDRIRGLFAELLDHEVEGTDR